LRTVEAFSTQPVFGNKVAGRGQFYSATKKNLTLSQSHLKTFALGEWERHFKARVRVKSVEFPVININQKFVDWLDNI